MSADQQGLFTYSIFSENTPGILHRITVVFTRRKLNIESLTVSETEEKGISRFTIVVNAPRPVAKTVAKQLRRIIEVTNVVISNNKDLIFREIAFIKVACKNPDDRLRIDELAHRYDAKVIYGDDDSAVVEKSGRENEIQSLVLLLEPFGVKEFIRSGRIAIVK